MQTTKEIKKLFIKYFEKHGHKLIASSSLIPKNDPTLLFTNAGMNQFKGMFLGQESCAYKRAITVQRCVRAGGKHNDLENVGYTKRHHTYFEMLGNFSFGDYFKREAIQYAWEFLTGKDWLNLPPEKLWITVHQKDEEAAKIWLTEIKINRNYFSTCGDEDNFWAMGEIGPCGYCSEIFYDYGADIPGNPPGGKDVGERYVEIWNLVFMQFERDPSGELTPLPNPSIDTGMGLERIAAVMQTAGFKESERRGDNYHTDVFENFAVILKKKLSSNIVANKEFYTATRVVADHLRATVALIADGVIPSNERSGYVLRKIIRRAIYHLWKLDVYQSNNGKLIFCEWIGRNLFIDAMQNSFPELESNWDFKLKMIKEIVKTEEYQFLDTLDRGLKVLKKEISKLTGKILAGETVFYLKDTLGFPEDLTREIAKEYDISIDQKEFDAAEEKQRQTSKGASKFKATTAIKLPPEINTKFAGYENLSTDSQIIAICNISGEQVDLLNNGEEGIIILDHTPFYAESGGQIGDTGIIEFTKEKAVTLFAVTDTKKQGAAYLHIGNVRQGTLTNKQKVTAKVNGNRHQAIKANHSAAHLLHKALRDLLGPHIEQRGSSITNSTLRFDFSHFSGLTHEEIAIIELEINKKIWANLPVSTKIMTLDEAKHSGAIALFDEKYAEKVRVVSIGDFSMELCGGTHVNSTCEIGGFKILSEAAIALGVRRIEACTAEQAFIYNQNIDKKLKTIAALFKAGSNEILPKIQQVLDQNRAQEKELVQLKNKAASNDCSRLLSQVINIGEVKVLVAKLENIDAKILRSMLDQLLQQLDLAVILLATVINNKIQLVVGVSKNCPEQFSAKELAQYVATQIGGSAGGKSDIAQGGGMEIANLDAALESILDWIKSKNKKVTFF